MLETPLLQTKDLRKSFGGLTATDGVSLDVRFGEIHALIGPNGAGKTTLVAQITGEQSPDEGDILLNGRSLLGLGAPACAARGLSRSYQITSIFGTLTALENTLLAVEARSGMGFRFWRSAAVLAERRAAGEQLLERVGLIEKRHVKAAHLAHGQQRQLEIAIALAGRVHLLVLDEPLAGMSRDESARIVSLLHSIRQEYAILLIEHDMDAVFALADRISVLVRGQVIASGSVDEIRASELVQEAYLGGQSSR